MILNIIILVALLAAAGHCKGRMDAIADEGVKSIDWRNKYDINKTYFNHWWYLGLYKPKYAEKFPFSSTILVFLTDRWHKWQFYMLRCFYMAIVLPISANTFTFLLLSFVIMPIIVGLFFEVSYNRARKTYRKVKQDFE